MGSWSCWSGMGSFAVSIFPTGGEEEGAEASRGSTTKWVDAANLKGRGCGVLGRGRSYGKLQADYANAAGQENTERYKIMVPARGHGRGQEEPCEVQLRGGGY